MISRLEVRILRRLVPGTGLEPAHLSALGPKPSVSAIPPPGLGGTPFLFRHYRAGKGTAYPIYAFISFL